MKKIKFIFFITIFVITNTIGESVNIQIKLKINNTIITNIDIENEKRYLLFLNPKLKELNKEKLYLVAKNSATSHLIKEQELKKFYNVNTENKIIDTLEKNYLLKKNIKNKTDYLQILKKYNIKYEFVKNKLLIESLWNRYIYTKYIKNIKINEDEMKQNILKKFNSREKKYEYNLSEIVIANDTLENLDINFSQINKSIKEVGFENSANIFSISNTSKNGGSIGWVSELQITEAISENINKLKLNETSKPIQIANGYIIIKLNDKREINEKIDVKIQLENLIKTETNRQLNNFSMILYKRLKKNTEINEF